VDYLAWTTLARALIKMGDYQSGLAALNTCPVTLMGEIEPIRLPQNARPCIPHRHDAPMDNVSNTVGVDSILEKLRAPNLRGATKSVFQALAELVQATGWDELLKLRARVFVMEEEYRAQRTKVDVENSDPKADQMEDVPLDAPDKVAKSTNKRLCERWLDNLFMILFEDMRVYTIYKGEMQHFKAENLPYQRTAREWLILGDLCRRLLNFDDAKEAYRKCVEAGFCANAWLALLEIYTSEGKLSHALNAAAKLMVADAGYYKTCLYPTPVGRTMYELIRDHGVERIKTTMVSLNLGTQIDGLVQRYLDVAITQKAFGHDF
jgi:tetratricopeptide (TPR) repeat protein